MLPQKTVAFILKKFISPKFFELRMGRHWGRAPLRLRKLYEVRP